MIASIVLSGLLGIASSGDYDGPPPVAWTTERPDQVEIRSTMPLDADKTRVTDALREAAAKAGCKIPVVEMLDTLPGEPMQVRVRCRDHRKDAQ